MSDEKSESRSFEDVVQDRQDWIEAQFRKISRGSWARIIRMARKPTPQSLGKQASFAASAFSFLGQLALFSLSLWTISFLG